MTESPWKLDNECTVTDFFPLRRCVGLKTVDCSLNVLCSRAAALGLQSSSRGDKTKKATDESVIFMMRISRYRAKKLVIVSALVSVSDIRFSCWLKAPEAPVKKVI